MTQPAINTVVRITCEDVPSSTEVRILCIALATLSFASLSLVESNYEMLNHTAQSKHTHFLGVLNQMQV